MVAPAESDDNIRVGRRAPFRFFNISFANYPGCSPLQHSSQVAIPARRASRLSPSLDSVFAFQRFTYVERCDEGRNLHIVDLVSVEQIKTAIEQLSFEERAELAAWLHGWQDDDRDEQIKRDVAAGKFDHILREVDEDIRAGTLREMPRRLALRSELDRFKRSSSERLSLILLRQPI
jgi:hypothetical protein